jgi:hypothetical protein
MILAHPAYERTSSLRILKTPDLDINGWFVVVCVDGVVVVAVVVVVVAVVFDAELGVVVAAVPGVWFVFPFLGKSPGTALLLLLLLAVVLVLTPLASAELTGGLIK